VISREALKPPTAAICPPCSATTSVLSGLSNPAATPLGVLLASHSASLSGSLSWSAAQSSVMDAISTALIAGASALRALRIRIT